MRRGLTLGLLVLAASALGPARAADVDDLLSALRQARTLEARGQVQITVNFPPRDPPTRSAARLPTLPARLAPLPRNFAVRRVGLQTVAGRSATRYDLTPSLDQAPRWSLWIDQAWNIPLAYEERGADGTLARRAAFTRVNPQAVKVRRRVAPAPQGLRAAVNLALPGFRWPAGFGPVEVRTTGERWTIILSDGLNVLSLVTAPRGVKAAPGVVSRQVGGRFVWLVGHLPQETLQGALARITQVDETGLGTFVPAAASNP